MIEVEEALLLIHYRDADYARFLHQGGDFSHVRCPARLTAYLADSNIPNAAPTDSAASSALRFFSSLIRNDSLAIRFRYTPEGSSSFGPDR